MGDSTFIISTENEIMMAMLAWRIFLVSFAITQKNFYEVSYSTQLSIPWYSIDFIEVFGIIVEWESKLECPMRQFKPKLNSIS